MWTTHFWRNKSKIWDSISDHSNTHLHQIGKDGIDVCLHGVCVLNARFSPDPLKQLCLCSLNCFHAGKWLLCCSNKFWYRGNKAIIHHIQSSIPPLSIFTNLVHEVLDDPVEVKLRPPVLRVRVGQLSEREHRPGHSGAKYIEFRYRYRVDIKRLTCRNEPGLRGPQVWTSICLARRTARQTAETDQCSSSWPPGSRPATILSFRPVSDVWQCFDSSYSH